jgi:Fungal Zn(2)-Cys(6) binuclear cluster domain/Aflatoxin regulatory protein
MDGGRSAPAQKLKDSCNKCSASKVRCNKEKPTCGRCDKLGYPCFYSPARRVGRPYRPRTTTSETHPNGAAAAAAEPPVRQPRMNRFVDESVRLHSKFPSLGELHISPGHGEPGESVAQQHQESNNISNKDAVSMHVRDSPMSQSGQVGCPPAEHDFFQGQSPGASAKNPIPLLDKLNPSPTTSSTSEHVSGNSTHGREKNTGSNASESDCATVAMDMLQQIDMTSAKLQYEATVGSQIDAQTLGAAIHTVTTAFRRLPTILICPCSERSDVGLLAAAVCVTILDVHGIIISNSTRTKDQPSPPLLEDAPQWGRMDVCTEYFQDRPEEEVTTMRVLAELAKVAKVVLQFTKRYSDRDAEECSPDFLRALATLLRSRLKSITNEATDWLA